jgi:hypothetical protein
MIKPAVTFNVSGEGWDYYLSSWHKPFEDGVFKGLGVITSRTRRPFTQLQDAKYANLEVLNTYQFSHKDNVLLLAIRQTF